MLVFAVGAGNQAGERPVAGVILDEQGQRKGSGGFRLVVDQDIGPGDGLDAGGLGGLEELDQGKEIGMVGDRDGRHAETGAALDQRLDVHQPVD